jgi:hypothetical protein
MLFREIMAVLFWKLYEIHKYTLGKMQSAVCGTFKLPLCFKELN